VTIEKIFIVVVCGPTASGKTALAVRLAEKFGGEIIGADSMQIYISHFKKSEVFV
jgi:tRNA dimethylallyltransferase